MLSVIGKDYLQQTCRIGSGVSTCRYITFGTDGIECAKGTGLQPIIDQRIVEGTMGAQGDNCPGWLVRDQA